MTKTRSILSVLLMAGGLMAAGLPGAEASVIRPRHIVLIPAGVVGSGNGTLDLLMFTESAGGAQNVVNPSPPGFDGDNANTDTPTGDGSTDSLSFVESYVTTAGDLQAFYDLNFGPGVVDEIIMFLDLNETTGGGPVNTLDVLDIILNPASITGSPVPSGDVTSAVQNAINQGYTGGTTIAWLDPEPARNIPLNNQGAGFADYAIFTGVNPYALNASDVLLFNMSMSVLSDGGETVFASGTFGPGDIFVIPEPGTLALLSASLIGLAGYRRRRKSR